MTALNTYRIYQKAADAPEDAAAVCIKTVTLPPQVTIYLPGNERYTIAAEISLANQIEDGEEFDIERWRYAIVGPNPVQFPGAPREVVLVTIGETDLTAPEKPQTWREICEIMGWYCPPEDLGNVEQLALL